MGKDLQGASSSSGEPANEVRGRSLLDHVFRIGNQFVGIIIPSECAPGGHAYLEEFELGRFPSPVIIEDIVEELQLALSEGVPVNMKQWTETEFQNFSAAVLPMLYEVYYSRVLERPVNIKIKDNIMEILDKVFGVYDARLRKHKYLAGDRYSLADFVHLPLLSLLRTLEVFAGAFDKRPHVKAWVADITSTTAFLKTNKLD